MIYIFFALIAGAILPIQAAVNAALRVPLGAPVWASLSSFLVGTCCLVMFAVATRLPLPPVALSSVPAWQWTGGVLGAVFVTSSVVLTPKLGTATTFGLVITGQLLASLVVDHFGWLGIPQHSINWPRVLGVGLMLLGAFVIRKF
jgi:transporter family-2 protein